MSEGEPNALRADDVAATEPPRIPLRIWHWFVLVVATMCLLVLTQAKQVAADAPFRTAELLSAVVWAVSTGLALTAFVAWLGIVHQQSLPVQVRGAPGHYLVVYFAAHVLIGIGLYLIGVATGSVNDAIVLLLGVLLYLALLAAIAWFAITTSSSLIWKLFHIAWLSLALGECVPQLVWPHGSNSMWVNNLPSYGGLIALALLTAAIIEDAIASLRPVYFRTWTHWAGIVSYAISVGSSAAWNLVLWQYIR